jgi:hypothetical protein
MALYPNIPVPSSVSSPVVMDPMLEMMSDAGYSVRRALASRPRRSWTLEYLGKNTGDVRIIRDFLQANRLGVVSCSWLHPTAFDVVPQTNTNPTWLNYQHGLFTGAWVNISSGPAGLIGQWQVTRVDSQYIILNGSAASGVGNVAVEDYVPNAIGRFSDNTWESPSKLIGPDQLGTAGNRPGYFNFTVQIEEVF